MNRYGIPSALDSEHAIVPAEFDPVLGRQTARAQVANAVSRSE
ncbi:MAG: hypothetical protein OXL34_01680 [Gemmatimonadota bacterium]|nr:hypothetical protein [Gemmatimonadota bacterium]